MVLAGRGAIGSVMPLGVISFLISWLPLAWHELEVAL